MSEQDSVEVKIGKLETKIDFVLTEIKNLRDGTYQDICNLKDKYEKIENEVVDLNATRSDFRAKIEESTRQCKLAHQSEERYVKFLVWIASGYAAFITGVMIWIIYNKK